MDFSNDPEHVAFMKELEEVEKDINPKDYVYDPEEPVDQARIDRLNMMTINELREMMLIDGRYLYTSEGELYGPNEFFGRYMKLMGLKKELEAKGIKCSDNDNGWFLMAAS